MPVIDADTARMRAEANTVNTVAQEFNQSVNQIYQAKDELGSMWKGEDAEKYKAKLEELRPTLTSLHTALVDFSDYVSESANNYDKQQQNIASAI